MELLIELYGIETGFRLYHPQRGQTFNRTIWN